MSRGSCVKSGCIGLRSVEHQWSDGKSPDFDRSLHG